MSLIVFKWFLHEETFPLQKQYRKYAALAITKTLSEEKYLHSGSKLKQREISGTGGLNSSLLSS